MNPIYARAIAEIRQTNPKRTIFVEPGGWGSIGELKNLVLPPDDNVIVSVHCYDPFYFTHQGATWTGRADAGHRHRFSRPARAAAGAGSEAAFENMTCWTGLKNTTRCRRTKIRAARWRSPAN